jgi:hypothetical protein
MTALIDLSGKKFGRLEVKARGKCPKEFCADKYRSEAWWDCVCECGRKVTHLSSHLRHGFVKSCGCLRREFGRANLMAFNAGHARRWRDEETATLLHGFIDLYLEGTRLHEWCLKNGLKHRTERDIEVKLAKEGCSARGSNRYPLPYDGSEVNSAEMRARNVELARQNLHNEIRLAQMERASAPPLKSGNLEW